MAKKIVIALGGNALGSTLHEQADAVQITARAIVDLIAEGHEVIVAHGNGPQVGIINNAMLALMHEDPRQDSTPLSVCGAMSQAYIGYDLQNALHEEMMNRGIDEPVVTMVTQVEVDPNDPAFNDPSKPIGKFLSEEEAKVMAAKTGFLFKEDAGRGWRRYVASPQAPADRGAGRHPRPQRQRQHRHLLRRRRHPRLPYRAQPPEGRGCRYR